MGDISYKPLIQDFTWSYSRIETYKSCKWKFFLRYIRGLEEDEMFYSSYGKLIHSIIEGYYNEKLTKDELSSEFLIRFSDEVQGRRPKSEIVKSYIEKGLEYLRTFTEKQLNFEIEGIKFTGIIDFLGKDNDGNLYIVDNKSRDLKHRSNRKKPTAKDQELDEMLAQLYLYSAAIEQEYGNLPRELCFNCFKNRTFIREPFSIERYNEVKKWAVNTIREIEETDEWEDDYEFFKCNYICGLNSQCEAYLDEREW